MKKLYIGLLFGVSCTLFGQKADIQIKIKDIKSKSGKLIIGLYNKEKDFPKGTPYRKVLEPPHKGTLIYTLKDVDKGEYALAILHDENNNGKMDIGMFGPKESYGFSNNARGLFSPPAFNKASFSMNGKDKKIELILK